MSRRDHYNISTKFYGLHQPQPLQTTEPKMEFPTFDNGDTLIIISSSHRYKLHSNILAGSSSTFARLFDDHPPPKLTKATESKGVTTKYKFTLVQIATPAPTPEDPEAVAVTYELSGQILDNHATVTGNAKQPLNHGVDEQGRPMEFAQVSPSSDLAL
jgi:hypothetical protein